MDKIVALLADKAPAIHRYAKRLRDVTHATHVEIISVQTVAEAREVFKREFSRLTHVLIAGILEDGDTTKLTREMNDSSFKGQIISISSEFNTRTIQREILERKHGQYQTDHTTFDPKHDAIKRIMGYPIVRTHCERLN
jgi:response regulator of citrate/malate metabolism